MCLRSWRDLFGNLLPLITFLSHASHSPPFDLLHVCIFFLDKPALCSADKKSLVGAWKNLGFIGEVVKQNGQEVTALTYELLWAEGLGSSGYSGCLFIVSVRERDMLRVQYSLSRSIPDGIPASSL